MIQTILITDDDPIIRRIVRLVLERLNHRVIEAENGREALSKAETTRPDLIIMDIMMPEMDGLTACKILKQSDKTAAIPIVILSANASAEAREAGYAAGAESYLKKPIVPTILHKEIQKMLAANAQTGN